MSLTALLLLALQSPAVSAELDRERVGIGDAVTLTIRALLPGTRPVRVLLPAFDGFTMIGRSDRRESGGPGGDAFVVELRLRAQRRKLRRLLRRRSVFPLIRAWETPGKSRAASCEWRSDPFSLRRGGPTQQPRGSRRSR